MKKKRRNLLNIYDYIELWTGVEERLIEIEGLPGGGIAIRVKAPGAHVIASKVVRSRSGLRRHLSRVVNAALERQGE
jgi:hypothetical protein